jgi:hypothetical protein
VAVFWFLSTFSSPPTNEPSWTLTNWKKAMSAEKEQLSCIRFNLMICEWRIFLWAEFLIRHSRAKIECFFRLLIVCYYCEMIEAFKESKNFTRLIKSPLYVHFSSGNQLVHKFCINCSASNFTVMYEIIMMIDGIFYL